MGEQAPRRGDGEGQAQPTAGGGVSLAMARGCQEERFTTIKASEKYWRTDLGLSTLHFLVRTLTHTPPPRSATTTPPAHSPVYTPAS